MKAIRYLDECNTQMDFIVVTEDGCEEKVKAAIRLGMDDFWDDGDMCFGEAVENRLIDADVPYSVIYCEDLETEKLFVDYVGYVARKIGLEVI